MRYSSSSYLSSVSHAHADEVLEQAHEGLRKLKKMEATMAYLGSYSPEAHALYVSVRFMEYDRSDNREKKGNLICILKIEDDPTKA